jgi:hypothetical protein
MAGHGLRPFARFERSNDVQLRFAMAERRVNQQAKSLIQDAEK